MNYANCCILMKMSGSALRGKCKGGCVKTMKEMKGFILLS